MYNFNQRFPLLVFIVVLLTGLVFSCTISKEETTPSSEYSSKIHENIIDLRVPGKWREAGTSLMQIYPHSKQEVLDSLFANFLSENKIDMGQWGRNEPILWVLAMIRDNYGVEPLRQEQSHALINFVSRKNTPQTNHLQHMWTSY